MFALRTVRAAPYRTVNHWFRSCGVGQVAAFPTNKNFSTKGSSGSNQKSSSSDIASQPNDRLHSTDIAFKPNKSGWGYTKTYKSNFQDIFKKNKKAEDDNPNE